MIYDEILNIYYNFFGFKIQNILRQKFPFYILNYIKFYHIKLFYLFIIKIKWNNYMIPKIKYHKILIKQYNNYYLGMGIK